jgi:hypothetical protein
MKSRKPPPFKHSGLAPEARELGPETGWRLWDGAVQSLEERFADTEPSSIQMRLSGGDPRYAATMPAALAKKKLGVPRGAQSAEPGARRPPSLDEVLQEARRRNRVCPEPESWHAFFEILQRHAAARQLKPPVPPLTGRAWKATPSLAKRMCLREQVEWAAAHGCLGAVHDALKAIPDEDWHHMAG